MIYTQWILSAKMELLAAGSLDWKEGCTSTTSGLLHICLSSAIFILRSSFFFLLDSPPSFFLFASCSSSSSSSSSFEPFLVASVAPSSFLSSCQRTNIRTPQQNLGSLIDRPTEEKRHFANSSKYLGRCCGSVLEGELFEDGLEVIEERVVQLGLLRHVLYLHLHLQQIQIRIQHVQKP